jgi:hypothetical protein
LAEKANLSPAPGIGFSLSLKWGNEIKTITPLDWNWRETIPEIEDLITSIAVHIFGEFEE